MLLILVLGLAVVSFAVSWVLGPLAVRQWSITRFGTDEGRNVFVMRRLLNAVLFIVGVGILIVAGPH